MSFRQWLSAFFVLLLAASSGHAQEPAYLNPSLSPQERAHDLVSRMTLDEKAAQLEDYATAIPRLGVPDYQTWNEALHGVARAGYVTVFPQAIGMAATWDPRRSTRWVTPSAKKPARNTTRRSAKAITASSSG